ncbi:hypothetical protein ATCC90586_005855 [Pythium insidiosum]|nr:hypothetical protein ATCC90586_005855 [Pythium insidiosum]
MSDDDWVPTSEEEENEENDEERSDEDEADDGTCDDSDPDMVTSVDLTANDLRYDGVQVTAERAQTLLDSIETQPKPAPNPEKVVDIYKNVRPYVPEEFQDDPVYLQSKDFMNGDLFLQWLTHFAASVPSPDNVEDVIVEFKKNNPKWDEIRVFVIDKDFRERSLLMKHFKDARILLCHYHVIKVFAKMSKSHYNALLLLLARRLEPLVNTKADATSEEFEDVMEDFDDDDFDDVIVEDDCDELAAAALEDAREDRVVLRGQRHPFFKYVMKNWQPWAMSTGTR